MGKLLIVDDDAGSLKTLSLVLDGRIAADVECCNSPGTALQRLASSDYVAVVSDIKMPTMDGLSLLKEVQALRPNIPVILISAYDEADVLLKAIHAGAYDFVRKPFDVDYLVASVTRAIQHSESFRKGGYPFRASNPTLP